MTDKNVVKMAGDIADDMEKAIVNIGEMLMQSVHKLLPSADIDLDSLVKVDLAIVRIFQTPRMNETDLQLKATIGIMGFAIAQNIVGKRRGYTELNDENDYRARLITAPLFQQLDIGRLGLNRTAFSKWKTPATNSAGKQPWLNWLLSQYVFTAALYGGVDETEAKLMRDQFGAVQWDWLHTDPQTALMDFKRFRNRNR